MPGKGAWEVTRYEFNMHESLLEGPPFSPHVMRNAVTESVVLHARQLCEIFLCRSSEGDNINLAHLVPATEQSARLKELITELERKYGSRRQQQSPCWVFNKMLMHPTDVRTDGYNYEPALNAVRPVLKDIVAEIESITGRQFERWLNG